MKKLRGSHALPTPSPSDGHSSGETHIGLATGTEIKPAKFSTDLLCLINICLNSG